MKTYFFRFLRILLKIFLFLIITSLVFVVLYRFVPVPFTPLMIIRCGNQVSQGKPLKLEKDWVPSEDISKHLKLAVICAEDQNFFNHWGFDIDAIKKAVTHNKRFKRKRGASTISQQVAKNIFLWPSRSWLRKALEVYFTASIELFWSKERILEAYLNVVELGEGIYGAEAASSQYFNKPAKKLTPYEAALLASILPNPRKYSAKNPGPFIMKRTQWVLNQMRMNEGIIP